MSHLATATTDITNNRSFRWMWRIPTYGYGVLKIKHADEPKATLYFVQTIEPGWLYLLAKLEILKGITREFRLDMGKQKGVPATCECDEHFHSRRCDHMDVFCALRDRGELPDSR